MVGLYFARGSVSPPADFSDAVPVKVVIHDGFTKQGVFLPGKVVEKNLSDVGTNCKDRWLLGMETHTVHTILHTNDRTGTEMTSGLLGLKFLLKMPQRQTIDLWEQVVSCSSLE